MDLNYQRMIVGYHGCDASVVTKVLAGEEGLARSERDYDWLGPGIYFWEHGPQRAYDWAKEEKQRDPDKIQVPAVLGAYINLGQCFDLLDTANTQLLQEMYPEFRRLTLQAGRQMPENKAVPGQTNPDKVLRYLDCAVIKFSLDKLADLDTVYHTVRGVFVEGGEAFPGAGIMLKSHVQVAVRYPRCILGFFRPNRGSYAED
ncbi:MAG TPA: hypothetical protein VN673_08090 [Clostridia bacterium]|nr:hypothetical protein [Clostridia bacterium]